MASGADSVSIIIGDKSGFTRLVLSDILNAVPGLEVLDTAATADELLDKVKRQQPKLVIAGEDLPGNSRLFGFGRMAAECPTPILMLTKKEHFTADFLERLLAAGVYDVIRMSGERLQPNFREIALEIVDKVRNVANHGAGPLVMLRSRRNLFPKSGSGPVIKPAPAVTFKVVVIGGSTGGTRALETIISNLDPGLQVVVLVAVHLPEHFTRTFTARLQELTRLQVVEGAAEMELKAGQIVVAPGGRNMIVVPDENRAGRLKLGFSEEEVSEFDQPSVDLLMKSVALQAGSRSLGVILTGMGSDGTLGARYILKSGGITIAQNEESSVIFGMAKSAIAHGLVKEVLDLALIPAYINQFGKQN